MRQIINGKVYNTETAQHITTIGRCHSSHNSLDFNYYHSYVSLYLSKKGQFFVEIDTYRAGISSAVEYICRPLNGDGIYLITLDQAKQLVEQNRDFSPEDFKKYFGEIEEG